VAPEWAMTEPEVILAVDPGRRKCGIAVGRRGAILARSVVASDRLADVVAVWAKQFGVRRVLVGAGTGSAAVRAALAGLPGLPRVEPIEEAGSTLEARRRYFRDHPPRGWRRLLPLSLQVPPEDYDGYVAELLLERAVGGRDEAGAGD